MAKKIFKKILTICYEEDFPELHKELISIEFSVKKDKNFINGIDEILEAIPLYAEEFPEDTREEIEILYEEYLESLEM